MTGRLRLSLQDWGDGTAELTAEVHYAKFCGIGAANFNRRDLRDRARSFAKFPINKDEKVEIVGGYWTKADPARLKQENLYIGVLPKNDRGVLTMQVRLAVSHDGDKPGSQCAVSLHFDVSYPQLAKFSDDFLSLVGTNVDEVVLEITQ